MCMAMGGGGGSTTPVATPTSPKETAAIAAQEEYRKQRVNRLNAYDGFQTDIVGGSLETTAGNDNSASGALKKLMGA
jgi:hypothetical protein